MEVFMGTVQAFGFNFAPQGWAQCQGQMMSISQYTALYALMGTYYGGDGRATFGLPNLQGRTIVGQGVNGTASYVMGQTGGNANMTLTQAQMPMHTHVATGATGSVSLSMQVFEEAGTSNTPIPNGSLAAAPAGTPIFSSEGGSVSLAPSTGTVNNLNVTLGMAGGSQPVNIESPYLAMNYSICIEGYFPSRN